MQMQPTFRLQIPSFLFMDELRNAISHPISDASWSKHFKVTLFGIASIAGSNKWGFLRLFMGALHGVVDAKFNWLTHWTEWTVMIMVMVIGDHAYTIFLIWLWKRCSSTDKNRRCDFFTARMQMKSWYQTIRTLNVAHKRYNWWIRSELIIHFRCVLRFIFIAYASPPVR